MLHGRFHSFGSGEGPITSHHSGAHRPEGGLIEDSDSPSNRIKFRNTENSAPVDASCAANPVARPFVCGANKLSRGRTRYWIHGFGLRLNCMQVGHIRPHFATSTMSSTHPPRRLLCFFATTCGFPAQKSVLSLSQATAASFFQLAGRYSLVIHNIKLH